LPDSKRESKKVVWVNGCFDVLHRGHIELFKYAKSQGDYLVVGVDTDNRIKRSKGSDRPFNKLEDRIAMLESIRYIDKVVYFDVTSELRAQILLCDAKTIVVGKEYQKKGVIGAEMVDEVKFFERIDEHSTTKILEHSSGR
jgi:rfaE bifunctional protein nucleotidyltransferase chain/domain